MQPNKPPTATRQPWAQRPFGLVFGGQAGSPLPGDRFQRRHAAFRASPRVGGLAEAEPLVDQHEETGAEIGPLTRQCIEAKIATLDVAKLPVDPLVHVLMPRGGVLINSLVIREGHVLQRAITEVLSTNPRYVVWTEQNFAISKGADLLMRSDDGGDYEGSDLRYGVDTARNVDLDIVVYDRVYQSLCAYEVKRGAGKLDNGKARSTKQDLLTARLLLASYGRGKGFTVESVDVFGIFYYGNRSLPRPMSISGDELDEHFGMSVQEPVEAALNLYRRMAREMMNRMDSDDAAEMPSC